MKDEKTVKKEERAAGMQMPSTQQVQAPVPQEAMPAQQMPEMFNMPFTPMTPAAPQMYPIQGPMVCCPVLMNKQCPMLHGQAMTGQAPMFGQAPAMGQTPMMGQFPTMGQVPMTADPYGPNPYTDGQYMTSPYMAGRYPGASYAQNPYMPGGYMGGYPYMNIPMSEGQY